jgi:hypothetical protein
MMITAETLKTLTTFSSGALARALALSGYNDLVFDGCKFLGITNGGQFCYSVSYFDEHLGEDDTGKVYLTYDQATGSVKADY